MKKMKRFLGIITAMIMAVTMLAGCGGNGIKETVTAQREIH